MHKIGTKIETSTKKIAVSVAGGLNITYSISNIRNDISPLRKIPSAPPVNNTLNYYFLNLLMNILNDHTVKSTRKKALFSVWVAYPGIQSRMPFEWNGSTLAQSLQIQSYWQLIHYGNTCLAWTLLSLLTQASNAYSCCYPNN